MNGQEPEVIEAQEPEGDVEGQEPETEEQQTFDAAYVKKLRREAAENRRKLRELEEVERERQKAEMSEIERLKTEKQELEQQRQIWEQQRQQQNLRNEIYARANKLGIVDPEAAYKLLDTSLVEFGDDGVQGVEEALQALLKDRPYLKQTAPTISMSTTNPSRQQQVFTRSQLRDPRFYAEHKTEIEAALREGRIVDE